MDIMKNAVAYGSFVLHLEIICTVLHDLALPASGSTQCRKKNYETILNQGAASYSKDGCMVYHSLMRKVSYCPPLNDIFMKVITVLHDDTMLSVVADREYLRKTIKEPRYEKTLDYQRKDMPLTFLSDDEIEMLIDDRVEINK